MSSQRQGPRSTRIVEGTGAEPFTHIRLIRQPELSHSTESSPRPTFRNPSLSFETESSLEEELSYSTNPSTLSDNLASHPQGVTFAARARAAELQAARARRELKIQTPHPSTRQEIMTFKARTKKKWSVLDLSTLPEPEEGSPISPYDSAEGSGSLETDREEEVDPSKESENLNGENKTPRPMSYVHAITQPSRPTSTERGSDTKASPSEQLHLNAIYKENLVRSKAVRPSMPSLEPLPVLSGNEGSDWDKEMAAKLINRQARELADLRAQLRLHNTEGPTSKTGMSQQLPAPPRQDRFAYNFNEAYRPYSQRQYPAVKGTLENTLRPTMTNIAPPPGLGSKALINHPRKASKDEKNYLLRHLHSVADDTPSGRSSLSQGMAINPDIPFDRNDLLAASEPLPWKDRRVPIAIDHIPSYHGYPAPPKTPPAINQPSNLDSLTDTPEKKSREEELNDWWTRDNRVDLRSKAEMTARVANAAHKRRLQAVADQAALTAANFSDGRPEDAASEAARKEELSIDGQICASLLLPVLANLQAYQTDRRDHFNRFAPPPSWAIDHTAQGNESFFSKGWGIPPSRVGRDPRYRAIQHDGRSSVFEDPTGKWPREEYNRGGWW